MKHNMMVVVYVDDTIIAGPDADKIEELIKDLGVADEKNVILSCCATKAQFLVIF